MNKKKTAIFMSIGLISLMCAVAVLFYNYREDRRAAKVGEDALIQLKRLIAAGSLADELDWPEIMHNANGEWTWMNNDGLAWMKNGKWTWISNDGLKKDNAGLNTVVTEEDSMITDDESRRIMIDGNAYCGYLTIEKLDMQLPVLMDVDDYKLQLAPCVYYGSIENNNLIIAAHNYKSHFGKINQLVKDDKIIFVDNCGRKYEFRVDKSEIIGKDMEEKMLNLAYQLTLFTCDYTGQNRVTVRCKSVK